MHYSTGAARIYNSIGIAGSTYEIGYREVARILGDLQGQVFLDYGSGAGRSAAFLAELGAKRVVAIDQSWSMLEVARRTQRPCVDLVLTRGVVPLRDASIDGAISICVLVELRTRKELRRAAQEMARAVRPTGPVVVMSTNPLALGSTFRNFRFAPCAHPRSGQRVRCTIVSGTEAFDVEDTHWTERDYVQALESAGLSIEKVSYPKPPPTEQWISDEGDTAPFVVISSRVTGL